MEKIKAFTLSEVLITIIIIGIIAAITVPNLIVNYQKKVTATKLKKGYSALSNIISLSEVDNGPMSGWEYEQKGDYNGIESEFYIKYFKPYITEINKYGNNQKDSSVSYVMKNIDGDNIHNFSWVRMPDGLSFTLFYNLSSTQTNYIWLFLDINNSNPPNRLGKDIYMLEIYKKKKLYFWGSGGSYICKKGTHTTWAGSGCGSIIIKNNWEIPNDYPW